VHGPMELSKHLHREKPFEAQVTSAAAVMCNRHETATPRLRRQGARGAPPGLLRRCEAEDIALGVFRGYILSSLTPASPRKGQDGRPRRGAKAADPTWRSSSGA
jgi:hypothetical protein